MGLNHSFWLLIASFFALGPSPAAFASADPMAAARVCVEKAKVAQGTCREQRRPIIEECKKIRTDIANSKDMGTAVLGPLRDNLIQCRNKLVAIKDACNQQFDESVRQCNSASAVAENAEQVGQAKRDDAVAEKLEASVEQRIATEKKADAAQKIDIGEQIAAQGAAQLPSDPMWGSAKLSEGQRLKATGQELESQAATLERQAREKENRAVRNEQAAEQQINEAMLASSLVAESLSNLMTLKKEDDKQMSQVEAGLDTAINQVDTINKATGGDALRPERTTEIAKKPKAVDPRSEKAQPGSNKGQGTNNPSNGNEPPGQAKKDEEGGGGGPGGGVPPMPTSSASQNPVSVKPNVQDCSNPSVAASNAVCACRLNPSDSRCNSILAAERERLQGPAKKVKVTEGEESGGGSFGGGAGSSSGAKSMAAISQHGQLDQNGGGSVGKGVGSGMGSGSPASDDKNTPEVKDRDLLISKKGGGTYGRGGGSPAVSAGYHSGAPNKRIPTTFGGGENKMGRGSVAASRGPSADDLRSQAQNQFNALRRGPSGVGKSLVGTDGITGPHTDQFKKIRVRYADAFGL